MALSERVHIARRFQRSVRIDSDHQDSDALRGFVCPQSSADVLISMARQLSEKGQGAFTWTGPYGSGKSSLVVALSSLLSVEPSLREIATEAIGEDTAEVIRDAMPNQNGWTVIPVVGRREDPVQVIGEAIKDAGINSLSQRWNAGELLKAIEEAAKDKNKGGLILFIDEMGKFLEEVSHNQGDVYIFQQLAEAASRSAKRFVVVGILHQAFDEYANRLTREQRDEWTKIQGRFSNLPVNVAGEEQLNLISRAIESNSPDVIIDPIAEKVAESIREQRPAASPHLSNVLKACWPIHPIVAGLLGPISRRRFGQNQRSIFGFLNSAEPLGLQDFLKQAVDNELYGPERLWEYLRYNLEPSILASPDGHRWSMAVEAIQRCESQGGDETQLIILKAIALIDLFREQSGLVSNQKVLQTAIPGLKDRTLAKALKVFTKDWSLIRERRFAGDFVIYAGSDFDIDSAVEEALEENRSIDFSELKKIAHIQPILAKRHYHQTGTMRWFDIELSPLNQLEQIAQDYKPNRGTIGQFILAIPTANENEPLSIEICQRVTKLGLNWDIVVGLSPQSKLITEYARELLALEYVRNNSPELAGDDVARRQVEARIGEVQGQLEQKFQIAFDDARWFSIHEAEQRVHHARLNNLASELADSRFPQSPILHNELLNRIKPSSSARAAQKNLLRAMVLRVGEERLDIEGYPAEGGLFDSILDGTSLYKKKSNVWSFSQPVEGEDTSNLHPLWKAAIEYLKKHDDRSVSLSELYQLWQGPPFGLREGLCPIIAVAFIQAEKRSLAFYRERIFQANLSDLDIDYLTSDPSDLQIRWMDLPEVSRRLLSGMAELVRRLDEGNMLANLEPIDVARGLISIYVHLPEWTKRTMQLSKNALNVRQQFKQANDPNKFLFDDLPDKLFGENGLESEEGAQQVVEAVSEGLEELTEAYPTMLRRIGDATLAELQVPNTLPNSLAELRGRADNIKQLTGDYRLDAFANRLIEFDGKLEHVEGLISLAVNKPPKDWADPDLDAAIVELADLSQKLVRAEAFARVKGRTDKRQAMAVMVNVNGRPTPVSGEFDITEGERPEVEALINRVGNILDKEAVERPNVILAALAELSARYIQPPHKEKTKEENLDSEQVELNL